LLLLSVLYATSTSCHHPSSPTVAHSSPNHCLKGTAISQRCSLTIPTLRKTLRFPDLTRTTLFLFQGSKWAMNWRFVGFWIATSQLRPVADPGFGLASTLPTSGAPHTLTKTPRQTEQPSSRTSWAISPRSKRRAEDRERLGRRRGQSSNSFALGTR